MLTEKQIRRIIDRWAPRLGLRDWQWLIEIVDAQDVDGNGAPADVGRDTTMHTAAVRIIADAPTAQADEYILHELVHCVLHPLWSAAQIAAKQLDGQAAKLAAAHIGVGEELVVQALVRALRQEAT